ncbi:hypothetical protein [Rhodoblastus sp.]|uniref:hypothetical protein n=1 Tax=Rhodoblastus sp. TaxID=1962975 RepID=UPI003F978B57
MRITKGLIIADPWIGYILDRTKDWEMRSSSAAYRGSFGLIRKGTGSVYGVARLVDVGAPLSPDEMIASFEHHRIPDHMIRSGEVAKWNTPWKLADVQRLSPPVAYRHRAGAVTWVELDHDASAAIARQLGELVESVPGISAAPLNSAQQSPVLKAQQELPVRLVASASCPTTSGALIGQVEITQGNIDHNHIYLRSFFERFPEDAVGGSNRHEKAAREVIVDWGGSAPIHTDLDGSKRFFRARGWIRDFFELHEAEAGDRVLIEETGPYAYKVRLRKTSKA